MNSKAPKKISAISFDRNSSYVFKYLIIGDNSVGKSALIQSFLNQENVRGIKLISYFYVFNLTNFFIEKIYCYSYTVK